MAVKKKSSKSKKPAAAKGSKQKEPRRTLLMGWSDLFAENERRVKEGKKPLTDPQLVERIVAEFPKTKGKSTSQRVRMFRSHYNSGEHSFQKIGSAESRGLPRSWEYGPDGAAVQPGSRHDGDGAPVKPKKREPKLTPAQVKRRAELDAAAKEGQRKMREEKAARDEKKAA